MANNYNVWSNIIIAVLSDSQSLPQPLINRKRTVIAIRKRTCSGKTNFAFQSDFRFVCVYVLLISLFIYNFLFIIFIYWFFVYCLLFLYFIAFIYSLFLFMYYCYFLIIFIYSLFIFCLFILLCLFIYYFYLCIIVTF
jgi:hypothetical protein